MKKALLLVITLTKGDVLLSNSARCFKLLSFFTIIQLVGAVLFVGYSQLPIGSESLCEHSPVVAACNWLVKYVA